MTALAIGWENGDYANAKHDFAEVDHDDCPYTLCPWIENLQNCPDGRWIFSVDIPDMSALDTNGYPLRPRSLAFGIVYSRAEAISAVEEAIQRLVGGPVIVP